MTGASALVPRRARIVSRCQIRLSRRRAPICNSDAVKTLTAPANANGTSAIPPFPTIDQVMVEERAQAFGKRSIKTSAKLQRTEARHLDDGPDDAGRKRHARQSGVPLSQGDAARLNPRYDVPPCAAVCVYPNLVRAAKKFLGDSGVKVASVATAFPTRTDAAALEA